MAEKGADGERRGAWREDRAEPIRAKNSPPRAVNVGEVGRYGSILGGFGLVLWGLSRRCNFPGLLAGGLGLGVGAALIWRGVSGHCALYDKMGVSSARSKRPGVPDNVGSRVERTVTINRSPEEVFEFWRDFRNLPRFMSHVERVELRDGNRSHWVARKPGCPGGRPVEWDAEIVNERPGGLIAWESLPGAELQNAGSVRFEPAPGGRGTELKVALEYNPPGGILKAIGAKLFAEAPGEEVEKDLSRLKQLLEAGELATTEGQPAGPR